MPDLDLLQRALGLEDPWEVVDSKFDADVISVMLQPYRHPVTYWKLFGEKDLGTMKTLLCGS